MAHLFYNLLFFVAFARGLVDADVRTVVGSVKRVDTDTKPSGQLIKRSEAAKLARRYTTGRNQWDIGVNAGLLGHTSSHAPKQSGGRHQDGPNGHHAPKQAAGKPHKSPAGHGDPRRVSSHHGHSGGDRHETAPGVTVRIIEGGMGTMGGSTAGMYGGTGGLGGTMSGMGRGTGGWGGGAGGIQSGMGGGTGGTSGGTGETGEGMSGIGEGMGEGSSSPNEANAGGGGGSGSSTGAQSSSPDDALAGCNTFLGQIQSFQNALLGGRIDIPSAMKLVQQLAVEFEVAILKYLACSVCRAGGENKIFEALFSQMFESFASFVTLCQRIFANNWPGIFAPYFSSLNTVFINFLAFCQSSGLPVSNFIPPALNSFFSAAGMPQVTTKLNQLGYSL